MTVISCKDWRDFHTRFLFPYLRKPRDRRSNLIFRGQADAAWPLRTTLDRASHFTDDRARASAYNSLLEEFRRESLTLGQPLPDGLAFELLARHHNVPSPMLDWTSSPYIATYFAFASGPAVSVAIWVFDRARFHFDESDIDYIDSPDLVRFNPRALRQRGVFMRVRTASRSLEDILDAALTKIVIPRDSTDLALAHMDEMGITSTWLFSDLDGAARTARERYSQS